MRNGIIEDFHYRNRMQRTLLQQIRRDYAEYRKLWEIALKRKLRADEIDALVRSFSWLKISLQFYRRHMLIDIEGRIDDEFYEIQKELYRKSMG